jgi:uncharacterized protein YecE (DUF72 family)
MHFGRTDTALLDSLQLTLPPEPANNNVLLGGKPFPAKIYLGAPQWGNKSWLGKLYPANTKENQYLNHYARHFNSIELNATHYKIYDKATITKWLERTGEHHLLFCPKMFNGITHEGHLKNKEHSLKEFLQSIDAFKEHLGSVFIQLSDRFDTTRKQELFSFLETLPQTHTFFLEVRHPNWFGDSVAGKELFNVLQQLHIGAIITDTPGRRDCAHMRLTIPKAFIRFVGNNLHPTDYTRADDWVQRIATWLRNGLQELYFFSHMPEEEGCPELIAYIAEKLNNTCGLQLQIPKLREDGAGKMVQGSMFD